MVGRQQDNGSCGVLTHGSAAAELGKWRSLYGISFDLDAASKAT